MLRNRSTNCIVPLFVMAIVACIQISCQKPDNPMPLLSAFPNGRPSIVVRLAESGSSSRQRKECNAVVQELGIQNDNPAPEATVLIDGTERDWDTSTRSYKITTVKPPSVRTIVRPGWTIGKLCIDALAIGLRVLMKAKGIRQPDEKLFNEQADQIGYNETRGLFIYAPTKQINNVGNGSGTTVQGSNAKFEQTFGKDSKKN